MELDKIYQTVGELTKSNSFREKGLWDPEWFSEKLYNTYRDNQLSRGDSSGSNPHSLPDFMKAIEYSVDKRLARNTQGIDAEPAVDKADEALLAKCRESNKALTLPDVKDAMDCAYAKAMQKVREEYMRSRDRLRSQGFSRSGI